MEMKNTSSVMKLLEEVLPKKRVRELNFDSEVLNRSSRIEAIVGRLALGNRELVDHAQEITETLNDHLVIANWLKSFKNHKKVVSPSSQTERKLSTLVKRITS